jgi:hypothetical protein
MIDRLIHHSEILSTKGTQPLTTAACSRGS